MCCTAATPKRALAVGGGVEDGQLVDRLRRRYAAPGRAAGAGRRARSRSTADPLVLVERGVVGGTAGGAAAGRPRPARGRRRSGAGRARRGGSRTARRRRAHGRHRPLGERAGAVDAQRRRRRRRGRRAARRAWRTAGRTASSGSAERLAEQSRRRRRHAVVHAAQRPAVRLVGAERRVVADASASASSAAGRRDQPRRHRQLGGQPAQRRRGGARIAVAALRRSGQAATSAVTNGLPSRSPPIHEPMRITRRAVVVDVRPPRRPLALDVDLQVVDRIEQRQVVVAQLLVDLVAHPQPRQPQDRRLPQRQHAARAALVPLAMLVTERSSCGRARSSRRGDLRRVSSTVRRPTSVGWAVITGLTSEAVEHRCELGGADAVEPQSGRARRRRCPAAARHRPIRCARQRRSDCTSSAMLASEEK